MKKLFTLQLCLATTIFLFAQIPTYQWAYSIGDVSQENLDAIVTDSENNVIIGGQMYSTTDMDPTEFDETLYQIGLQDAFIEKFPADGSIVTWGVSFGGLGYDGIYKMAVDDDDNIYAIGYYGYSASPIDLNPDMVDQDIVTHHGGYDMFIVKFNKDGEYVWGHGLGGLSDDWINNIVIDGDNLYVTGQFIGTVDFDGSAYLMEINSTLDKYDGFLAKYNLDGEIDWVFRIGGTDDDYANELAVDNEGNIIVTGTFQGNADFYGEILSAADGTLVGWPKEGDAFVAKYDNESDLIWAKSIRGDYEFNGGYSNSVFALALDDADNIYITGLIYGEGDFDMNDGEHEIETYADYDSYFAKYTADGDLVWANTTAPKVTGYNLDMLVDGNNDIYLTGYFGYSAGVPYEADFDFNTDSIYALQSLGNNDIYIAKYDSSAELTWAYNLGGSGYDYATAIALDNEYNICVGGWFFNSDDFDANPDTNFIWLPYTIPTYGDNCWIGKYKQDGITIPEDTTGGPDWINDFEADASFSVYPNPATEKIIAAWNNDAAKDNTIYIYDINGSIVKEIYRKQFFTAGMQQIEINIEDLSSGMYFLKIETPEKYLAEKIIIQQ